jgi:hypothetical protein
LLNIVVRTFRHRIHLGGIVFSPDDSRVAFGLTVPFNQRRIKIRNTPQ